DRGEGDRGLDGGGQHAQVEQAEPGDAGRPSGSGSCAPGPASLRGVTVELTLLARVSYASVEITGSRLQDLAALLAAEPRAGCSAARLVDELWPDEHPEHPFKALQILVSRA